MRSGSAKISLIATILLVASGARAQEYSFGSALSQGASGVVALIPSSPSTFPSHPSLALFSASNVEVEASYRQLYGLDEFEDFVLHARYNHGRIAMGFSSNRFGESGLYQEHTLAGGVSYRCRQRLGLGCAISYHSAEFGDGQSRYAGADLAVSATYQFRASVLVSTTVRRITLDRIYDEYDIDPAYELAVAWRTPSEVALGAMLTREADGDNRVALAQILRLGANLEFLSGLRFEPVRYSLGGRASYQQMSFVYSYNGHPDLGATHSFGMSWGK